MSFLELTKKRHSVRKYEDQPVEGKLLQVLEATERPFGLQSTTLALHCPY